MSSIDPAFTLSLSRYDGRTVSTDKIALPDRKQA
jgi:hypothetical protein